MKIYVVLVLLLVGLACGIVINDNGQPGCKTDEEMTVKYYRNIWDPTRLWVCHVKGSPGVELKCPDSTGWLDSKKQCVEWDEWVWEVPKNPPSKP